MDTRDLLSGLDELFADQWGMVTAVQAAERGVSRAGLDRLADQGRLVRLGNGVYRDAAGDRDELRAAWLSLDPARLAADRLADGPRAAVVSGASAARLHGFAFLPTGPVEFAVPERPGGRRTGVRLVVRELAEEDVVVVDGLPVTTVERTIADLVAARTDPAVAGAALAAAVESRWVDAERLAALLAPHAAKAGAPRGDGQAALERLAELGGIAVADLAPVPVAQHLRALERLGRAVAAKPWAAIAAWIVAVLAVAAFALAGVTGEKLTQRMEVGFPSVDEESAAGRELVTEGVESDTTTLLVHGVDREDPALASAFAAAVEELEALGGVEVVDPLGVIGAQRAGLGGVPSFDDVLGPIDDEQFQALFSADGRGVLLAATVEGEAAGEDPDEALVGRVVAVLEEVRDGLREDFPGATVEVGSAGLIADSLAEQREHDLVQGESVALPIAFLVMLVVFGGVIAALLPMIGAGAAIVVALGGLFGVTYLMTVNSTVLNIIIAVGLALAIDYGLLMVSRFREEYRLLGSPPDDRDEHRRRVRVAVGRAVDSAGRTALFSGTVFGISSAGLLLFDSEFIQAIGVGALLVTVLAIVVSITLTPALITVLARSLVSPGVLTRIPVLGPLLLRFGDIAPAEGLFSRLTRTVQRAPVLVTLAGVALLALIGSPVLAMSLAQTSTDAVPRVSDQHGFITTLEREFPEAAPARIVLVAEEEAGVREWAEAVAALDGVTAVHRPVEHAEAWSTTVVVEQGRGMELVPEVRELRPEGTSWVTGLDADTADFANTLVGGAPWAVLVVAIASFVFLFLATGSFLVPVKALVLSTLSLSAAVGVLVWGFQWGHLASLMNFEAERVYGVDIAVLLLSLVFGFGLAMDYELFILSRIVDQFRAGVPVREAIAAGLQRSGRIITSAALIIIVVFAGFATGHQLVIKGLGVALASAVLIDATVVRMLLVPAVMTWAGKTMFWAPAWARKLHDRIGLSES